MDFSNILSAFNGVAIVAAISAIAAIKILPSVARWAFSQLIIWFPVGCAVDSINASVIAPVADPVQQKQIDVKKRSGAVGSSSVHPAFIPSASESVSPSVVPAVSPAENLAPESRFKVFGAIYGFFSGFFGGFFTRFFSFFKKR